MGGARISRTENKTAPSVAKIQQALLMWRPECLPTHGADGDYGFETAGAVQRFKVEELRVPEAEVIDDVGPKTVQRLDKIALAQQVPACTVSAFNVPVGRSGCVREDGDVGEHFRIEADFSGSCACCEYRQFVRGSLMVNFRRVEVPLADPAGGPPRPMLPRPAPGSPNDNFLEDSQVNAPVGGNVFYGRRSGHAGDRSDLYLPDRATGCQYRGTDFPNYFNGAPGDVFTLDFDFRGQIIDTCNGNAVMGTAEWNVTCNGII